MPEQTEPREKGQSIILVAIAMLALMIFAAIAVDISHAYVQRRTAQNGADAAALAGARNLRDQFNTLNNFSSQSRSYRVKTAMNDYAERNGVADTDDELANEINANVTGYWLGLDNMRAGVITFGNNDRVPEGIFGVEAVVTRTAQTFFGGIIGLDGLTLHAEAAVSLNAGACGVTCVVPIATYWNTEPVTWFLTSELPDWTTGPWGLANPPPFTCYNIWNGQGEGNFGWLDWRLQNIDCPVSEGNCSEPCLQYNLDPEHCIGWLAVGVRVAGSVGVQNGSEVREQLDKWIGWDPSIPGIDPINYPPQAFTLPLYEESGGVGCTGWYTVAGFAKMQLLGYQLPQGGGAVINDPWLSQQWQDLCTLCRNVNVPEDMADPCGEEPNKGTRLTAFFLNFIDETAMPGDCDVYGTVTTGRVIK